MWSEDKEGWLIKLIINTSRDFAYLQAVHLIQTAWYFENVAQDTSSLSAQSVSLLLSFFTLPEKSSTFIRDMPLVAYHAK